ncbi:uncharacterized protein FFUJ_14812 [Fusarium fujikuroi IMI 58289]|uniref:Uncharacterized protein n=1 Tax=Gibberella fujikuroi (strain CBS 195.34 / IMI 58289 / NRRL A-6831) TaxID=1279085 RepID=S0DZ99_GIBF5|nr:uncharacterized protein FFUJ_14812 [Fusarium fujikuroi IMI 58289]KLO83003.1 uncharacterized protein Y057_978 [Fusarium fujikuroi]KLP23339.1 uncharacterized protein LW94_4653 [Fusarium fujikuroi]CCT67904.1 uncharacterized protein FFUJ_14812 [Fusarium fujikuroi IMI 58289]
MYGHTQCHSHPIYHPPPTQMQGLARFKIIKPSFYDRYECKPDNAPGGPVLYNLAISSNQKKHPDLVLNAEGKIFRIGLGDPLNVRWTEMLYRGKDKYGWTFTFNLPNTGRPVPMTWRKGNSVAVDGMKASRLSDNNFKLLDPNGQLMAVFTSHTMSLRLSAVGTLQINIDLGPMSEYAVITTFLPIYDFQTREEDIRSSRIRAAGAAASSSCC